MRSAARAWCAVVLAVLVLPAPCFAQEAGGTPLCRRDARTAGVLAMFETRGVPEAEMVAVVQSPDVFRQGAGDAAHRLALLRAVYDAGEPGVTAPDCSGTPH